MPGNHPSRVNFQANMRDDRCLGGKATRVALGKASPRPIFSPCRRLEVTARGSEPLPARLPRMALMIRMVRTLRRS